MFMYLYSEFKSRDFQEMYRDIALFEFSDLADFYEKYGPDVNPKDYISFYSVTAFFEGIGCS